MPRELFVKNLRYIFEKRRIKREVFARQIRVSHSAPGQWMRGFAFPQITQLVKISDVLNISIDDLVRSDLKKRNA